MAEITAHLSDEELRALQAAAQSAGVSIEEFAAAAISAAVSARYTLPVQSAQVVTFQGLKSLDRRRNRE